MLLPGTSCVIPTLLPRPACAHPDAPRGPAAEGLHCECTYGKETAEEVLTKVRNTDDTGSITDSANAGILLYAITGH